MLIIDAHLDIALNALQGNRDMLATTSVLRTRERSAPHLPFGQATVTFPEMRRGRVALCFGTLFVRAAHPDNPDPNLPSLAHAYASARSQLAYYRAMERQGHVRIIGNRRRLDEHIAVWRAWETTGRDDADAAPPIGIIVSLEGADPVSDPTQLAEWWEAGVRLLGLSHFGDCRYAGGTGSAVGLTKLGKALLAGMETLGMPLDLSHTSDAAFWEALARFQGPVFASHNNCRALVPHPRQFSDAQLRALLERRGVIGISMSNWMLTPGWEINRSSNEGVTLAIVADHIDHICQLAGNSKQVGLGSDLDGGFGKEETPVDLDTIADLQKLAGVLQNRGYGEEDVAGILHGNWLSFLRRALA